MVTGEALAALGPDGKFSHAQAPLATRYQMLSGDRAMAVARHFWGVFGGNISVLIAQQLATPINADLMQPCGQALFAESSFDAAPTQASLSTRYRSGPQWIVPICERGNARAMLSVAAFATELDTPTFVNVGSDLLSAAFDWEGLPAGTRALITAEEAAAAVAGVSGAPVSEVPRFMRPTPPFAPSWGMWVVPIAHPVAAVGAKSRRSRDRSVLFYGQLPSEGWRIAVADDNSLSSSYTDLSLGDGVSGPDGVVRAQAVPLHRRTLPAFGPVERISVNGRATP